MMAAQSTAQRYHQTQLATADRGRLLLLMFEGGLKFLALARGGLESGDLARFGHNLARGQAIIAELLHTLDHKAGGEIAGNLERLYQFMLDHLVEANLQKSAAHLERVTRILGVIAGAYREIITQGVPAAVHAA
jgi:flagellar protein FliS